MCTVLWCLPQAVKQSEGAHPMQVMPHTVGQQKASAAPQLLLLAAPETSLSCVQAPSWVTHCNRAAHRVPHTPCGTMYLW
jgi:hypothetical protein